jgi:hypothetical protein
MTLFILIIITFFPLKSEAVFLKDTRFITQRADRPSVTGMDGYGVIYNSVVIERKSNKESDKLDKEKEQESVSEFYAWVRNCGEVRLEKKESPSLKNGDKIKLRLSLPNSCEVADYRKY